MTIGPPQLEPSPRANYAPGLNIWRDNLWLQASPHPEEERVMTHPGILRCP